MKIILTGATGFAGGEVLKSLIADDRITSIAVLSRRALKEDQINSKVEVIIHEDFLTYHEELVEKLKGATACIWCIGGKASDFPDLKTAHKVQVDYTLAAADAFVERLLPMRFVFLSGAFAARDGGEKLWFLSDTRRLKGGGRVEQGLVDIAEGNEGFETFIMRPGGILPADSGGLMNALGAIIPSVKVDHLAKVMIEIALSGSKEQTLENGAIAKFQI